MQNKEEIIYGKNAVTELLKSKEGVDTVFISKRLWCCSKKGTSNKAEKPVWYRQSPGCGSLRQHSGICFHR